MQTLDLFKSRRFNIVKIGDGNEYKIPNEFTVEQVERLLELKAEQERLSDIPTADDKEEEKKQVDILYSNMFAQLEVMFQAFHPEITAEYLKKYVSHNEALEVVGFFQKYRALAMDSLLAEEEAKKKLKK